MACEHEVLIADHRETLSGECGIPADTRKVQSRTDERAARVWDRCGRITRAETVIRCSGVADDRHRLSIAHDQCANEGQDVP